MKDYEMYDGEHLKGVINVYWDNIHDNVKKSLISSNKGFKYKILNSNDINQKYELTFSIDNMDDLYDIVNKYINEDKLIFEEINNIKKYNNIKNIKKEQEIKLLIPITLFSNFNKTKDDIDKNSLINSKIYFIKEASNSDHNEDIRNRLDKTVNNFTNIINSNEYAFYDDSEKNNLIKNALDMLDKLIKELENSTNFRYGKNFCVAIKVK